MRVAAAVAGASAEWEARTPAGAALSRLPPDLHFPPIIASLVPTLHAVALAVYTVGLQSSAVVPGEIGSDPERAIE